MEHLSLLFMLYIAIYAMSVGEWFLLSLSRVVNRFVGSIDWCNIQIIIIIFFMINKYDHTIIERFADVILQLWLRKYVVMIDNGR